jgi:hypothetical protein
MTESTIPRSPSASDESRSSFAREAGARSTTHLSRSPGQDDCSRRPPLASGGRRRRRSARRCRDLDHRDLSRPTGASERRRRRPRQRRCRSHRGNPSPGPTPPIPRRCLQRRRPWLPPILDLPTAQAGQSLLLLKFPSGTSLGAGVPGIGTGRAVVLRRRVRCVRSWPESSRAVGGHWLVGSAGVGWRGRAAARITA